MPSGSPKAAYDKKIGVDLGVSDLAVFSDGGRVANPRWLDRDARRLRRAHRSLSRKRRQSRNRERARRRLARDYARVANRRADFLHKLTTNLIRGHDLIAIEDIGIAGLARTKLGRRIHDASLREFRRQLVYKAELSTTTVVVVDRFFPSTKRCSSCGLIKDDLSLQDRVWKCECGAHHDRDLNAAKNILAEGVRSLDGVAAGHADTSNARGGRVRLPKGATVDEARTP
jgi:putative transposase